MIKYNILKNSSLDFLSIIIRSLKPIKTKSVQSIQP